MNKIETLEPSTTTDTKGSDGRLGVSPLRALYPAWAAAHAMGRAWKARTEFGFARTACSCANCSINCRFIPGYLIPADLERIAAHVGAENVMAFAADNLLASPGAIVGTADGQTRRIQTLVPARRSDGACKFLSAEGQCTIHEVSPFGCAFFDSHQSSGESNSKSVEGLMAVDGAWHTTGSMYSLLWLLLNEAGLVAPAPIIARAQMKAAMAVEANL